MLRGLLVLLFVSIGAYADHAPYDRSPAFENGTLGPWPTEAYRSAPVIGPALNQLQYDPRCRDGRSTLLAPRGSSVRSPGPMILDQDGHLAWTRNYGLTGKNTYNVNVYPFRDQAYLTFWVGDDRSGKGEYYMLNSSYLEEYRVLGANNLTADRNEFQITPDGTAILTVVDIHELPDVGWIRDGTFQEVEVATGSPRFQWRASDHVEPVGPRNDQTSQESPLDPYHISSVDKDTKGNYLVSLLSANSLVYVDGRTGKIIWTLGGGQDVNDFEDLSEGAATSFFAQSHAHFVDTSTGSSIALFDNHVDGSASSSSRALYLDIDQEKMTVRLRKEYHPSKPGPVTLLGGSVQLLEEYGRVLVSYGAGAGPASWTEHDVSTGEVLCDVHFAPAFTSTGADASIDAPSIALDRVVRQHWTGYPPTRPDLALSGPEATVSWNGATEVTTWVVQGWNANNETTARAVNGATLDAGDKELGFVTAEQLYRFRYLRVLGINATGHTLGSTKLVRWDPLSPETTLTPGGDLTYAELAEKGGRDEIPTDPSSSSSMKALERFAFFALGFLTACISVIFIWLLLTRRFVPLLAFAISFFIERIYNRACGGWAVIDGYNGDEDLTDEESPADDATQFELLGNPRLASLGSFRPGEFGRDYYDNDDDSDSDDDIV
ncbi:hypothetical protein P168DRAFT_327823 [Aspergillus campestris IBT 28561]|uniref:ASST-domain-containing protein n=1 Tax=Aspergillus campestris (strain IBT 28561) TaxID=1392248 RepID=A0A2I1D1M7_ASPC2|nr:uncharacterized protein P168DRAFT_327823 [Aspergillus campestris IBT 28561]PKY03783.1 hypothetical protein P168DRAFT_327823 [Aspergillus campestris IBT 28561]